MSYSVNYSESNVDNSGQVSFDGDSMTGVVTLLESSFGINLTRETMLKLLMGESIQAGNLDVWVTELQNSTSELKLEEALVMAKHGENQNYRYNQGVETFRLGGMRDVPIEVRPRFEKMVRETFTNPMDTVVGFNYENTLVFFNGLPYYHVLIVSFMYWDGYELCSDSARFLIP